MSKYKESFNWHNFRCYDIDLPDIDLRDIDLPSQRRHWPPGNTGLRVILTSLVIFLITLLLTYPYLPNLVNVPLGGQFWGGQCHGDQCHSTQFSRSTSVDATVNCDRCNSKFSLKTNPTTCTSCKIRVCKECRDEGKTVGENDGWLCKVCLSDRLDISFLQLYIETWPFLQKLANAFKTFSKINKHTTLNVQHFVLITLITKCFTQLHLL